MTRKKVKLAYITNDAARKATYKKRKRGLLKKVNELSTLCGIDTCAIIYSPYEAQPEVYPANQAGVQRVLAQFKRMPEMEQSKKMVNQESFLRQRIAKAKEQLKKQIKENREKEMTELMFQCLIGKGVQSLGLVDLNDLGWVVEQYLKDVGNRIEAIQKNPAKAGFQTGLSTGGPTVLLNDSVEEKPFGTTEHQQMWYDADIVTSNMAGGASMAEIGNEQQLLQIAEAAMDPMMMMMGYSGGGGGNCGHAENWNGNPCSFSWDK